MLDIPGCPWTGLRGAQNSTNDRGIKSSNLLSFASVSLPHRILPYPLMYFLLTCVTLQYIDCGVAQTGIIWELSRNSTSRKLLEILFASYNTHTMIAINNIFELGPWMGALGLVQYCLENIYFILKKLGFYKFFSTYAQLLIWHVKTLVFLFFAVSTSGVDDAVSLSWRRTSSEMINKC